jgi:HAD superfamily hydrolase (TIGR01509 family)
LDRSMREVDTVFFDLGDTIVDLREGNSDYAVRVAARAQHVYDAIAPRCPVMPDRQEFIERLAYGTEAFYLAAVARLEGVDIYDALHHLFDEMSIPADDGLLKEAGDAYYQGNASLAPLRIGAAEVLGALRARGLKLGVISNTLQPGRWADLALERRGLLHLLAARIYSSEVRVAKPHPAIFHAALDAFGVAAERAVHVGDRLVADVSGAQAVGMKAVLIEVSHRSKEASNIVPDARIRELPELLNLLPGLPT